MRFVKYLNLMIDYLDAITRISKKFQENNLLIIEVEQLIEDLVGDLELLKDEPGDRSREFQNQFDSTNMTLNDGHPVPIVLKGQTAPPYTDDNDVQNLLAATVKYIANRFQHVNETPVKYFNVFNFKFWPQDDKELLKYGRNEVKELTDHFGSILTEEEKSNILREWTVLKNRVKKRRQDKLFDVYSELLGSAAEEVKNILVLVNIMVTISPSTAECERQFSAMNNIKTALRSSLNQDTLEALMRVKADGPAISEFNPISAIHYWMDSGKGTRHLGGHRKPRKADQTDDVGQDTEAEEDSDRELIVV